MSEKENKPRKNKIRRPPFLKSLKEAVEVLIICIVAAGIITLLNTGMNALVRLFI